MITDLNQTPDFSKSVMESLERVGQLEGASLINPVDAQIQLQQQPLQQDQPFPVMLHANSAAQASSVALPGTSNQQGSAPSTSGGKCFTFSFLLSIRRSAVHHANMFAVILLLEIFIIFIKYFLQMMIWRE